VSAPEPSPVTAVPAILAAVWAMNPTPIMTILDDTAVRYGLDVTLDEVVFPALRVVGTFWANNSVDIAHEHLLSSAATRWVYGQLLQQQVYRRGRILLAAGPDDLHVLGLDCLELLLACRGVEVFNLGGRVPVQSLVLAATSAGASAVVVCSHNSTVTPQAVRAVKAVAAAGLPVYYAGSSFTSQFVRLTTPGDPLDATLSVSADLLTGRHTVAQAQAAVRPSRASGGLTS